MKKDKKVNVKLSFPLNNHKQKTFQLMTELHSKTTLHKIRHQKSNKRNKLTHENWLCWQKQVEEKKCMQFFKISASNTKNTCGQN